MFINQSSTNDNELTFRENRKYVFHVKIVEKSRKINACKENNFKCDAA